MSVSVIIPVYNGADQVGAAIDSALAQDFAEAEIVAVDDGSTDSTRAVLEHYEPRIKVLERRNGGLCAARNTAVAAAGGDYLALLDADDIWQPSRLRRTVEPLERNPKAVMAFCGYVPMDHLGSLLNPVLLQRAPTHEDLLHRGWPIVPSAVTIRRSALEAVGLFCEEFKGCAGGEDHYMWLRLSEVGCFECVSEPLVVHRRASPAAIVNKYEAGRRTFVRLVKQRYGRRASARVAEGKDFFAGTLLSGAAEELASGNLQSAACMIVGALRYKPWLLFSPTLLGRVLRTRNLRRLANALSGVRQKNSRN